MTFFGRLIVMLVIGLILGGMVGILSQSPALAVGAFLLWCLSRQKAVFSIKEHGEED